jgi:hypothetical protein
MVRRSSIKTIGIGREKLRKKLHKLTTIEQIIVKNEKPEEKEIEKEKGGDSYDEESSGHCDRYYFE